MHIKKSVDNLITPGSMFWYENFSDLTAILLFPIIFNVTCDWLNKIAFSGFSLYFE